MQKGRCHKKPPVTFSPIFPTAVLADLGRGSTLPAAGPALRWNK